MAILPSQLARVSNNLRTSIVQRSLSSTQRLLAEAQNELATGKRINTPSDDPAGASAAMQIRRALQQHAGYLDNLRDATGRLEEVDTAMGDLGDLLRQALSLASANASSTVSQGERQAAATTVTSMFSQAINLGNKSAGGVYIFGGDRPSEPPFISDPGGVRFAGSDAVLRNAFDDGVTLPFTVDPSQVFGALSARIQSDVDLSPAVALDTRLSDMNGAQGNGIHLGSIAISNGTDSRTIDLSGADTLGDVVNAINNAAVGSITASISADGKGITLSGAAGESITVSDPGGTTAADLGILTPSSPGAGLPVAGQSLQARVTPLTRLADLKGGAGIDQTSGMTIVNGTKTATINLASAVTVEDLLNAINGAGVGAIACIDGSGTGIDVQNSVQGLVMTIAENGGTTAADLGIRSFSPQSPLSQLNDGKGVRLATTPGPDIQIARQDGSTFQVDLDGLSTAQDVIDAINAADAGGGVTASFSTTGNGIVLTDTTSGAGTLSVQSINFSQAAEDLGLSAAAVSGTLAGKDVNGIQANGVFANLAALHDALVHNDQAAITRAAEGIQKDLDRIIGVRGQVAAQVQDLEQRENRIKDQDVASKSLLSSFEDADYNEVITRFQTLQTALQANLQTAGKLLNMTLLDFLE